jgi:hypothetical protein
MEDIGGGSRKMMANKLALVGRTQRVRGRGFAKKVRIAFRPFARHSWRRRRLCGGYPVYSSAD